MHAAEESSTLSHAVHNIKGAGRKTRAMVGAAPELLRFVQKS